MLEVGYIANISHHLTANDLSLNQVPPQLMTSGNAQLVRPFPQFNNVTWINPSIGNSTYHGGFIRAEKRMSGGLSFLAHYTFSKFLDDVEAANEFGTTGSYMDAYNRRLDKGLSGSDVPHRVLVELLYEVRRLQGQSCSERRTGRLEGRRAGNGRIGSDVHRDHYREHHEFFPRRIFAAKPLARCVLCPAGQRTRDPLVRYFGLCQSGAAHLWGLSALGTARRVGNHHRRNFGEELPAHRALTIRRAWRVLQSAEPRDLQCPRIYLWRRRLRRGFERTSAAHGAIGGAIEFLSGAVPLGLTAFPAPHPPAPR